MPSNLTAPRPLPDRTWPQLVAGATCLLALPVFLAAGWPLRGWLLAAALWMGAWLFGYLVTKLPLGADHAASSAAIGLGMSFRTAAVGVVLVIVAVSNERVGIAAVAVYALAFTVELALSLVSYYSREPL
jgi:hypothetical protein